MHIKEIYGTDGIDSLLAIVKTHLGDANELLAVRKQLLNELSLAGRSRHFYIAEKDNSTVAMIQLVLDHADHDPELADGKEIAHVHNLQVRHEWQGQGIGRRMMDYVEETARQMGKKILTLGVDEGNERAIRLYHSLGYQLFKTEPGRTPEEIVFV